MRFASGSCEGSGVAVFLRVVGTTTALRKVEVVVFRGGTGFAGGWF